MKIKFYILKQKKILISLLGVLFITSLIGCNEDTTPSLWESRKDSGTQPVITSMDPATEALAGVDEVVINGTGFSSVLSDNFVYFGSARATVLEASATRMLVRVPNNPGDSLEVKCTILTSDYYSDPVMYKLRVAAGEVAVKNARVPYAITLDNSNNMYFSAVISGNASGIMKVTQSGDESSFAPKGGELYFNSLKVGPNNILYGARKVKAIFQITEGIAPKAWATTSLGTIADFDFDNKGFIWAGGAAANEKLYRINFNSPKVVGTFDFSGEVKAVRYYDNALYVAATRDNAEKIYKIPVVSDSVLDVANAVEYFNFSTDYPEAKISCITFSSEGVLYAGNTDTLTTNAPPIIMVNSDKSSSVFFDVLLGDAIYRTPVTSMCWGTGDDLYFVRGTVSGAASQVVRVITKKYSAPYYGRE